MRVHIQYAPGLTNDDVWGEYTMEQFFKAFAMEKLGVLSQQEKDMLLGSALIFGCQWKLEISVLPDFSFEVYQKTGVDYYVQVRL